MFVAGAIFLRPDIRDLRSISVQGKFPWQHISDDGHNAPHSMGILFDNGLDRHAAYRMA
jgi:hypothetical protein